MAGKKDRSRFSIKFNENDPAHDTVIELLEKQGHNKAQFIANAILHYIHCPGTSGIHPVQTMDKASIEEIVMEILKRQDVKAQDEKPAEIKTEDVDSSVFALIADTMSAFRGE